MVALLLIVILLSLPFLFRPDGKTHAPWEQFLGRFHVLALHVPIGLLLLVPLLEIAGALRPALREAAGFVLALSLAACLGTLTLGFLLAHGGGFSGATVTWHMWGGIVLTIGVLLCLLVRPAWAPGAGSGVYSAMLGGVLLTLLWTAHQGGTLTHGSGYLTKYMPASFRRVLTLGLLRSAPASGSFYAAHIDPVFDANCVSCHGASKTEGGMRLDSYDQLMRGGKDGAVILAGQPEKSILFERITLPDGNQHRMPAEGRPALRPEEIAWLRAWIEQGASPSAATLAGIALPGPLKEAPPQPVGDYSALMPDIRAMQTGLGAKLIPVSANPSDGLVLNTVDVASSFGDAQLAQFSKFAPYVVELELGRTAVTDASFDTLSAFTHLRALHLEGTAVTGAGLSRLTALSQLTYLNLSDTRVTASAVAPLQSMKNLHHLYLFDTPAQPAPATAAAPVAGKIAP
jgi:mono/diheme cytochrome c family protein